MERTGKNHPVPPISENQMNEEDDKEIPPSDDPYLLVYDGDEILPPQGFQAVTIRLDGRLRSDLDWKIPKEQAQNSIEKGYSIFWDINLGLFRELVHPLAHQSQFLSLVISLEHFRDTLWKEFQSHTVGLSLLRGSADFSKSFLWDDEQEKNWKNWLQEYGKRDALPIEIEEYMRLFCQDVAIEYIALLAARLPDALVPYVFLDASFSHSILHQLQLLHPERFDRLHLAVKGNRVPMKAMGWELPGMCGYSGKEKQKAECSSLAKVAICLPPLLLIQSKYYEGVEEAIRVLQANDILFRLIAESHLTQEWNGLDFLLYHPLALSKEGKRKVQGFCAAGGTVVSLGNRLEFPQELEFNDWLAIVKILKY